MAGILGCVSNNGNSFMLDLNSVFRQGVEVCAVTKGRTLQQIKMVLAKWPQIKLIGENRWPDCELSFMALEAVKKYFIGPLQKNKVRKVVPLVDVIESVADWDLLVKIDQVAREFDKRIGFLLQVNIAEDSNKSGLLKGNVEDFVQKYLAKKFENVEILGLMTIGSRIDLELRRDYFRDMKDLFDEINRKYFKANPLPYLSMGMSDDFEIAVAEGATIVRLGRVLFENI